MESTWPTCMWMDGQMDRWIYGWMDERTDLGRVGGQRDVWMNDGGRVNGAD